MDRALHCCEFRIESFRSDHVQTHAWSVSKTLYYPQHSRLISDLDNIAISITGFSGPDLLHIERLIALLGGQYYSNLTRKRSLLLTPDGKMNGPKLAKAREWDIPIVSVDWLWEVIARGNEQVGIDQWSEQRAGIFPNGMAAE